MYGVTLSACAAGAPGTVEKAAMDEPNITTSCSRQGVSTEASRPAPSASTAIGVMPALPLSSSGIAYGAGGVDIDEVSVGVAFRKAVEAYTVMLGIERPARFRGQVHVIADVQLHDRQLRAEFAPVDRLVDEKDVIEVGAQVADDGRAVHVLKVLAACVRRRDLELRILDQGAAQITRDAAALDQAAVVADAAHELSALDEIREDEPGRSDQHADDEQGAELQWIAYGDRMHRMCHVTATPLHCGLWDGRSRFKRGPKCDLVFLWSLRINSYGNPRARRTIMLSLPDSMERLRR